MAHSPLLGAFVRAEKPLTIEDLLGEYRQTARAQISAELEKMQRDGHIEASPFATSYRITNAGRAAWMED